MEGMVNWKVSTEVNRLRYGHAGEGVTHDGGCGKQEGEDRGDELKEA